MTIKLTVLYGQPDDAEAFDRHYFDVHLPIARQWPTMTRMEVATVSGSPMGDASPYHLMFEAWFDDIQALQATLGSESGRAAGEDFGKIAPEGSMMLVSEVAG